MIPTNLKYTQDHLWVKLEGNTATLGVTDHGQNALGEVRQYEISEIGQFYNLDDEIGMIEGTMAGVAMFSPLSGEIIAGNGQVQQDPTLVNQDPYGEGWLVKINVSNPAEYNNLLDSSAYASFIS